MMEGDTKLSLQAKKWVQDALLDSSKRSKKIVRVQAYSLARKPSSREQFQHARWDGRRILNFAVRDGHRFLCDLLLEELKVDPNLQDSFDDTTPLHHAAATGQVEVIELLLNKYFCDIEAKDCGRSTPLCLATLAGRNAALQKLLDCGASTEAQCFLGQPIHLLHGVETSLQCRCSTRQIPMW